MAAVDREIASWGEAAETAVVQKGKQLERLSKAKERRLQSVQARSEENKARAVVWEALEMKRAAAMRKREADRESRELARL